MAVTAAKIAALPNSFRRLMSMCSSAWGFDDLGSESGGTSKRGRRTGFR
jgi:hypothetical protein